MSTVTPQTDAADGLDRRQQRLMLLAWSATLLPLVAFGYLTWQSWVLSEQVQSAQQTLEQARAALQTVQSQANQARADLEGTKVALDAQKQNTIHYRRFAGIKIRYYRPSDRALVEKALAGQGFDVEAGLGSSALIDREPSTLGYGERVSVEDRNDIAVALVTAGFPLKAIRAAERQRDPQLLQIYASAESDRRCGPLTVDLIRQGETCGPLTADPGRPR